METPSLQRVLGLPSDVPYGGKIYKFGPASQAVMGEQEKAFVAIARTRLKKRKEHTAPEDWQEDYQAFLDRVDRGHYAAGEVGWANMLQTADGWNVVYLSMFRVSHPEMTEEVVRKIETESPDELLTAVAEQMPGFFAEAFPKFPPEVRAKAAEKAMEGLRRSAAPASETPESNGTASL